MSKIKINAITGSYNGKDLLQIISHKGDINIGELTNKVVKAKVSENSIPNIPENIEVINDETQKTIEIEMPDDTINEKQKKDKSLDDIGNESIV